MFNRVNKFELSGVVRNATEDRAFLRVEGVEFVMPVNFEGADKLVGKLVTFTGTLNQVNDTIVLNAEKVSD